MPRRLQIPTHEMGVIQLYLIYSYNGNWEDEWKALQGWGDLPVVPKEIMDHALIGWTKPLVNLLGPGPDGRLRLVPKENRICALQKSCVHYDKTSCHILSKDLPWCFEMRNASEPRLASDLIKMWRDGVYILIVEHND